MLSAIGNAAGQFIVISKGKQPKFSFKKVRVPIHYDVDGKWLSGSFVVFLVSSVDSHFKMAATSCFSIL